MAKSNEEKLQRFLNLVDPDAITSEQFKKAFKKVLDKVKEIDDRNKREVKQVSDALMRASEKLKSTSLSDFNKLKGEIDALNKKTLTGLDITLKQKLLDIDKKLSEIKDGEDADEERVIKEVINRFEIPTIEDIKNDLPIMGIQVRDALELLEGEERLEIEAINGLKEKLEELMKMIKSKPSKAVAGGPINQVQYADVSAQCDGSNKTFSMPNARHIIQVTGTQYPIILRPGVDFTVGNKSITLTDEVSAPESGQSLIILFIK